MAATKPGRYYRSFAGAAKKNIIKGLEASRGAVIASSGAAQPGELIALTREEFDSVKPFGSVEGDWREKKPAKPADAG